MQAEAWKACALGPVSPMLPYAKAQTLFLESDELWFTAGTKCHEWERNRLRTFGPAESAGDARWDLQAGSQLTAALSADPNHEQIK